LSICTFIASDHPLPTQAPSCSYPLEINLDNRTVYDGDADDNFFLLPFRDAAVYTDRPHCMQLEWNYATEGRAQRLLEHIKTALQNSASVELWHVWLMDYWEYEDSPVFFKRTVTAEELTTDDIIETACAEIWCKPDKYYPERPAFYCLTVVR